MSKKYDIYITFPTGLIEAESKLFQTANAAVSRLKLVIQRVLKHPVVFAWKGENNFNQSDHLQLLHESKLAVFFTHPEFEEDNNYISELENICDVMEIEKSDSTEGYSRIFRISLEPPKKVLSPRCLEDLITYDFFEKNLYNRKIKSLDFESGDKISVLYSRIQNQGF